MVSNTVPLSWEKRPFLSWNINSVMKKSSELCGKNTWSRKFDKGIISTAEFLVTINKGPRQKLMSAINTVINLLFHMAKIMLNSIYSKWKLSPSSLLQHFGPLPFGPHVFFLYRIMASCPDIFVFHQAQVWNTSIIPKDPTQMSQKSLPKWDTPNIPQ